MTQTQHPSAVAVVLRRTFDAPCETVFDAWTKPEIMQQFLGPRQGGCRSVQSDFRVGGSYRIVMPGPDGTDWAVGGTYREISKPERVVCTWRWEEDDPSLEHDTLLTLEFHAKGTQTELVLTHENFKDAQSCEGHTEGWSIILDKYAEYIA